MGIINEAVALFEPGSPHRTSALSTVAILGTTVLLLLLQANSRSTVKLPFAGVKSTNFLSVFVARFRFIRDARGMVGEGYRKYSGKAFQVPTYPTNKVILSSEDVDALKNAPDSKISMSHALSDFLHAGSVGMDILRIDNGPHAKVCRTQLTKNLAKLIEPILDETRFSISKEFPEAQDWTSVDINHALLRTVARISGRIFVGPDHCRNEEWLNTSVKFTEDMFANAFTVSMLPSFIRRFVSFCLPYAHRVARHRSIARKYLAPTYAKRIADHEAAEAGEKPKIDDVYSWMVGAAKPELREPEILADFGLLLSMAAIHTTTLAVTMTLCELATRPEYIGPLREEIENAIREDGGVLKKSTMGKMMRLDSFMKESLRFNCSITSFMRKTLEPITLSNGTEIPADTMLAAPLKELNNDPSLLENPKEFDGYRWYKLRQQADQFNSHQFVSTSVKSLVFGYGTHACPGRFFAANEIQVMLTFLLLKYDFKYPEGEERLKNWEIAEAVIQNPKTKLMFKRREEVPDFEFLRDL